MRRNEWNRYVCQTILTRRFWYQKSKTEYIWAVLNLLPVLFLTLDMTFGIFQNYHPVSPTFIFIIEAIAAAVYAGNFIFHLYLFLWPKFVTPYPVPKAWKELLQIPNKKEDAEYWQIVEQPVQTHPYRKYAASRGNIFGSLNYWETWCSRRIEDVRHLLMFPCHRTAGINEPELVSPRRLTLRQALVEASENQLDSPEKLSSYLHNYEKLQENIGKMMKPLRNWRGFAPPGSVEHMIAVLSRYRYQQCPKVPSPLDDDPPSSCSDNVWTKQRVSEQMLNLWCDRLRKWICQTIIIRLVDEINYINKRLEESGTPEFKIGDINLFTLKQVAVMKSSTFPRLPALIPYLEIAQNQEYIVCRLKDLASDGCMRLYKWNSGSFGKERPWSKDLPYDSTLVMHLFCTYLDSLMPCDTATAKKKFFTKNYFKQTPYKPDFEKGKHYIYQSKVEPPHYTVVIDDEVYGVPKGQNNLFCAILLFLHYIKMKENGIVGRVNLGSSGLNILWVLDW